MMTRKYWLLSAIHDHSFAAATAYGATRTLTGIQPTEMIDFYLFVFKLVHHRGDSHLVHGQKTS